MRDRYAAGDLAAIADAEAAAGDDAIVRVRALARLGRRADAHALLERLSGDAALRDAAEIESCALQLQSLESASEVARRLESLRAALPPDSPLLARLLTVAGTALLRAGQAGRAAALLLDAIDACGAAGYLAGRAEALAALGNALAWSGDLQQATQRFALALADWAALGNRRELAQTLVDLGRLNLEARRHAQALEFLSRANALLPADLEPVERARMPHWIGQCHLGLGRNAEALEHFRAALAEAGGSRYLEFVAARDAALAAQGLGDDALADAFLARAGGACPDDPNTYETISLRIAQAGIGLRRGHAPDPAPVDDAAQWYEARGLRAPEIHARLLAARLHAAAGQVSAAERHLDVALRLALARQLDAHAAEARAEIGRLGASAAARAEEASPGSPADRGLGAYVLRQRLGEGAFGTVHRAYDLAFAREVALKEIDLARVYDVSARARLLESARVELEAAARVNHPGIARVHALNFLEPDRVLLVQSFVDGEVLRTRMRAPGLPPVRDVLEVMVPLLHALEALHAAGVVHRDLKPENVILGRDGDPVLVDLGIAQIGDGRAGDGAIAGTLGYMAPEQVRGEGADARADLYAFGAMLHEWLSGSRPLPITGDRAQDLEAILRVDPPALRELRPDVPPPLEALVRELLRKRRWRRPSSAREVFERLRQVDGRGR